MVAEGERKRGIDLCTVCGSASSLLWAQESLLSRILRKESLSNLALSSAREEGISTRSLPPANTTLRLRTPQTLSTHARQQCKAVARDGPRVLLGQRPRAKSVQAVRRGCARPRCAASCEFLGEPLAGRQSANWQVCCNIVI